MVEDDFEEFFFSSYKLPILIVLKVFFSIFVRMCDFFSDFGKMCYYCFDLGVFLRKWVVHCLTHPHLTNTSYYLLHS